MPNELKRILLVEDSPQDVELTLSAFREINLANEVVVVHDGAEALDFLYARGDFSGREGGLPAVMLLDLKLPKVDGAQVLAAVRADPAMRQLPVVILTSSREEQDVMRAYENGTNAYVVKPVDFEQFTRAIRELGIFWAVHNVPPLRSRKAAE